MQGSETSNRCKLKNLSIEELEQQLLELNAQIRNIQSQRREIITELSARELELRETIKKADPADIKNLKSKGNKHKL